MRINMKLNTRKLKKIGFRLGVTLGLCLTILLLAVLYPGFMYAHATPVGARLMVYHNQELDTDLIPILKESYRLVEDAEIFDPNFEINICLNDGSSYPDLIRKIRGEAYAYGFADNTVVAVEIFPKENYAIWNGRKRILTELFAHEFIHNYQYNTFGFSTLNFPFWKLEGYPEYVMTRNNEAINLHQDLETLLRAEAEGLQDWDWIVYDDEGFGTTPIYLRSRLLVQYLIEVKGMSYRQIIENNSLDEQTLRAEMISHFNVEIH